MMQRYVTCRGHDGCIDSSPGSSVRGHTDFVAMVRTSVQARSCHFLSIRAAHVPSLLNCRADTLSRKRDSSRRVEVAPRVG